MTAKLTPGICRPTGDHEGPTPIRSIRMADPDWDTIKKEADKRGFGSASEFIRATMLQEIRMKR